MSSRAIKWILLLLCVATLPLPFFGPTNGVGPPLRLLFIGSLTAGVLVQDLDFVVALITGVYLMQGLLWTLLLYFVVRFVTKLLMRLSEASRGIVVCVVAVVLIGSSFFPNYRLPMSSSGIHSNILGLFD